MAQLDWSVMQGAGQDAQTGADMLILTEDGQERRTGYDGGHLTLVDATHTPSNKQSVTADTLTHFTVDGQGAGTDIAFRRGLPSDVFQGSTLRAHATGEVYSINLTMQVSKSVSSAAYLEIDVGIGQDHSTIAFRDRRALTKGSGTEDFVFFNGFIPVTEAMARYGARFYINASEDVLVWNKTIQIQRTFTP